MKRARLLAFVLTAAMATTVFLGGTVARYQTTASIDDTATVAKWGVKLTMAGDLYGYNYNKNGVANGDKPTNVSAAGDSDTISVEAKSETAPDKDQVAPGTSGDTLRISLTGETEVDVKITTKIVTQDVSLKTGKYAIVQKIGSLTPTEYSAMTGKGVELYTADNDANVSVLTVAPGHIDGKIYYVLQNVVTIAPADVYNPMVYTVTEAGGSAVDLTSFGGATATGVKGYLEDKLGTEKYVDANTSLNNLKVTASNITWSWAIGPEGDDPQNDKDTILGALQSGDQIVVKYDGTSQYNVLKVGTDGDKPTDTGYNDGYVFVGTPTNDINAAVGSVKAYFSIEIKVEQVD